MIQSLLHSLSHFFGLDNLSGAQYGFWSGIGSDIGEVAILGGIVGIYRKHNCHVKGCVRIAKHPVDGTPYVVCAKHHPDVPERVTFEHLQSLSRHKATPAQVSKPE
jgi:hypothetical protein